MAVEIISNQVKDPFDLEFIVKLAYDSFKDPHGYHIINDARNDVNSILKEPSNRLVVAYDSRNLVGFSIHWPVSLIERIHYSMGSTKKTPCKKGSRTITMLAVSPKHRKEGIGLSLVKHIMEESKKAGVPQLYASCWRGKNGESYHLFKKLGYAEFGRCRYFDGSLGILVMKDL